MNPHSRSLEPAHNISALPASRSQLGKMKTLQEMEQGNSVSLA
jgi:hypothetical protein